LKGALGGLDGEFDLFRGGFRDGAAGFAGGWIENALGFSCAGDAMATDQHPRINPMRLSSVIPKAS
jgi:hypothetical protein